MEEKYDRGGWKKNENLVEHLFITFHPLQTSSDKTETF